MDFLDEEVLKFRKNMKKEKYSTLETGMYIGGEMVHFKEEMLYDDRVKVMLPDTFIDMPSSMAKIKYPSEQRPQIIKTSLDACVNFTFSLYETEFDEMQVKSATEQFQGIIRRVNPAFLFYDCVVEEKGVGWFDFKSYGLDEAVYNIMYVLPVDGKLLHGIFNCRFRDCQEWKEAAHQVILSVEDCTKKKEIRI